jgi:hypothetical protein
MHTKFLLIKPEGKRHSENLRVYWKGNITIDIREIGWEVVEWMHLV